VFITYFAFNLMVGLGFLFVALTVVGWLLRDKLLENNWYLKLMLLAIPLPYVAAELGWIVAEVGRQPWIVYGLMKTSDAVSPVAKSQVWLSFLAFIVVYGLLGAVGFYLIGKKAKQGPEPA
jgi:cytochrome d ubiquinol oxidase subunit I